MLSRCLEGFTTLAIAKLLAYGSLPCGILTEDPPILAAFSKDVYRQAKVINAALPKSRKAYILLALGYECETPERADEEVREYYEAIQHFKTDVECIFLCNTLTEVENLTARGVKTVFCHQNCFLDEHRYPILQRRTKAHDAVYLARVTPCKRHHLASQIKKLLIIGDVLPYETAYAQQEMASLSHAVWLRKVYSFNVPRVFAASHVGLCLSQREGAMYVSAEYLLCGLPIVNTPNIGGRDVFFDPEYTETVSPTSEAVAEGVYRLIDKKPDPAYIRNSTIQKMQEHRERFIALLEDIFWKEGKHFDREKAWDRFFFHKLGCRTVVSPSVSWNHLLRQKTFKHYDLSAPADVSIHRKSDHW